MARRGGLIAVVIVALVLVTAAYASTSIIIDRATVPGGTGRKVVVSVTYGCDPPSGVKKIVVEAEDSETKASGQGQVATTCDGGSHLTDVTIESVNSGTYRRGKEITATARLADANGNRVGGAEDRKILYPH